MLSHRKSPTTLVAFGAHLLAARLGYVGGFLNMVSGTRSSFIALCRRNCRGHLHGSLVGSFLLSVLTSEY
jgi:hypothetical protein